MDSFDSNNDPNPPSYVSKIGLGALMKQLREFRQSNTRVLSGRQLHPTLSPAHLTSYKPLASDELVPSKTVTPEAVDKPETVENEDDFDLTFRPTPLKPLDKIAQTEACQDNFVELKSLREVNLTDLEEKIIRQCEYYFGDYNLPKDRFMRDLIDQENGWLTMATMLTFPRLNAICKDPFVIMSALEKSPNQIIEIDRDFEHIGNPISGRIRRHPSKPIPEFSDERKRILQDRTVYVGGFPKEGVSLDDLIEFFENGFEKVIGVRMRTARKREDEDYDEKPDFLGSAFVTFATKEAAEKFISASSIGLVFGSRKLFVKWQADFFIEKPEYTDKFRPDILDKTVFVAGFDKQDTQQSELVAFFGQFDGATTAQKRVFRDRKEEPWKFAGSVFVTFEDSDKAKHFLALPSLTYNGDKLIRKSQLKFFEETGKFQREIQIWRQNNDDN